MKIIFFDVEDVFRFHSINNHKKVSTSSLAKLEKIEFSK